MKDLIDIWQGKRILVAGDPMHDCYHFGHVDRVSPEAPVPVFVEDYLETRPGGAYNVCQNLAALGCAPVQCFPPEPWTVKRRFMVGNHQLLRADYDKIHGPPPFDPATLEGIDAVVLSDYAKGWLTEEFCQTLIVEARQRSIPIVVDPKNEWIKFVGCTVICPNKLEYERLRVADYGRAIDGFENVLLKLGAAGLRLHSESGYEDFPATAKHVFDVTGAGDTVVATLAAALAAGGSLQDGARLANLAAGHVVGEVGTASCSAQTLRALCS